MDIKSVVEKYIALRDEKAIIAERHKQEMAPLNEAMDVIEKWLLQEMDKAGVDSMKTAAGTPYKTVTKSVKMSDPAAFKSFVFAPLIDAINNAAQGMAIPDAVNLLQSCVLWDMIDFRAGKKGIIEYTEESGQLPPGVTLDQFATVNIRRS